jgi:hypothetical protein
MAEGNQPEKSIENMQDYEKYQPKRRRKKSNKLKKKKSQLTIYHFKNGDKESNAWKITKDDT